MMRNKSLLYSIILFTGISFVVPCYAEQETDDADIGGFIAGPKWKEEGVIIPSFPSNDDLLKVEIDKADSPFNLYLDSKNLSVSSNDGVVRYTVVIASDSGARNVLFEGMRCQTAEFRTYAYGTYDNKLVKARTSEWQAIKNKTSMPHRFNFYQHYMCNEYQSSNAIDIILRKVKYPEDFEISGERDD